MKRYDEIYTIIVTCIILLFFILYLIAFMFTISFVMLSDSLGEVLVFIGMILALPYLLFHLYNWILHNIYKDRINEGKHLHRTSLLSAQQIEQLEIQRVAIADAQGKLLGSYISFFVIGLIFPPIILVLYLGYIAQSRDNTIEYRKLILEAKLKALQPHLKQLDPAAQLHPFMRVLPQDMRKSTLFSHGQINSMKGEDLIQFKEYGSLELSEYRIKNRFGLVTHKGIFGYAKFPFYFEGATFIKDRKSLHTIPGLKKLEDVSLESVDFDKNFEVFSNTQMGSRLALRTDIMDLLNSFKKVTGRRVNISFVDGVVYFNILHNIFGSTFIHVEMKKPILESLQIDKLEEDLHLILSVIAAFKLKQS